MSLNQEIILWVVGGGITGAILESAIMATIITIGEERRPGWEAEFRAWMDEPMGHHARAALRVGTLVTGACVGALACWLIRF